MSVAFYSANPWYSVEVSSKYRGGRHFAWFCEYFDSEKSAPPSSAGTMIAPSSNPRKIYEDLLSEYNAQEEHSRIIKDHKRKFKSLAKDWLAKGEISNNQCADIISSVQARSWRIWKPVIYVIPKAGIDPARIKTVRRPDRAGYGPEFQIADLQPTEFDIIDLTGVRLA